MTASILVVEHLDPERLVPSGIDTIVKDIVKFATDRDVRIVGITTSHFPLGRWVTIHVDGREIQFLPIARFDRRARRKLVPHSLLFIAGLLRFRKTVIRSAFESDIHAHRLETGRAIAFMRIGEPIQFIHNAASNLTGRRSESTWKLLAAVYRVIERRAVQKSRALVVFNRLESQRLARLAPGRCIDARTWYDPNIFFPPTAAGEREGVAWVGRLEEQKNPLLAVAVAEALRTQGSGISLTIVGDGSLKDRVEESVRQRGLSDIVNLAGPLPRSEVGSILRKSKVLLMTSHFEGSPTALVEALACDTPAVVTSESDQDGLLDNAMCGRSVPDADPQTLAASIVEVASRLSSPAEIVENRSAPRAVRTLLTKLDRTVR